MVYIFTPARMNMFSFPYFRGTVLNSSHSCFASDAAQLRWVLVLEANRTEQRTLRRARTLYTICWQCVRSICRLVAVMGHKTNMTFGFDVLRLSVSQPAQQAQSIHFIQTEWLFWDSKSCSFYVVSEFYFSAFRCFCTPDQLSCG